MQIVGTACFATPTASHFAFACAATAAAGLGVLNTATSLGHAAAPVLGALVIGWAGYSATFIASIIGALVCSVAIALVKSVR